MQFAVNVGSGQKVMRGGGEEGRSGGGETKRGEREKKREVEVNVCVLPDLCPSTYHADATNNFKFPTTQSSFLLQ